MSKRSEQFDIAQTLGRIESKVDATKDSVSKVIYGLIGLIAAVVGVQFYPHSPIDWMNGIEYATRFLTIFTLVFVSIVLLRAYWKHKPAIYLALGFALMSLTFMLVMIFEYVESAVIIPLRFIYCALLILYAINIKPHHKEASLGMCPNCYIPVSLPCKTVEETESK